MSAPRPIVADESAKARFWRLVDTSGGPESCWPWRGAKSKKGSDRYGSFRTSVGMVQAHRFALHASGVDVSGAPEVLHGCDTPLCCNPKHLRPGTKSDNMRDARDKGRLTQLCCRIRGRFARVADLQSEAT